MPLITDFTFKDRELDPTDCRSKESRVDVLGMCSDGTIIEIEFQLTYFYPMEARSLLYWARLFTLQIPKGGDYKNLKRTVCINILAHSIFDDTDTTDYYNAFGILNKRHPNHILTGLLEMYFIELPKWEKVRKTEEMSQLCSPSERFSRYFRRWSMAHSRCVEKSFNGRIFSSLRLHLRCCKPKMQKAVSSDSLLFAFHKKLSWQRERSQPKLTNKNVS